MKENQAEIYKKSEKVYFYAVMIPDLLHSCSVKHFNNLGIKYQSESSAL